MNEDLLTVNIILYCAEWEATVHFYREGLGLPVDLAKDWFVEFRLGSDSRLSVADERRASIKTSRNAGLTVSLEVADIEVVHEKAKTRALNPTEIIDHPWGAKVFYLADPDGHRLEIWQNTEEEGTG